MKKLLVLFAVTALAVTALSVGYALWSTTVTIDGTVSTGNVDARWSIGDQYQWTERGITTGRADLPPTDGVYRSLWGDHAEYTGPDLIIELRDIQHRPLADPPPVITTVGRIRDFYSHIHYPSPPRQTCPDETDRTGANARP
jgi:hypothetical protein